MMQKIKQNKGITLIALVITIIILLILAGITIVQLNKSGLFGKAQRASEVNNEAIVKEELERKVYEVQIEKSGTATLQDFVNYLKDDEENNYIISLTKTAKVTGITNIGEATEIYILYKNYQFKISNILKIEYVGDISNGEDHGGENDSETKEVASKPDVSKIAQKTYVTWNFNETETKYVINDTQTIEPDNWYDYNNGKWANIKTTNNGLEAYWVWIPRYEYIIPTSKTATEIEVKFIPKSQTTPDDGYIIHPAFTNEGNRGVEGTEGFGELDGIWVAKFETCSNKYSEENGGSSPSETNQIKAQVIPGVPSWRNLTSQVAYKIGKSIQNEGEVLEGSDVNPHMMKSTEWGAVAILSQSKYGIYNPASQIGKSSDEKYQIWNNPSNQYITGSVGNSADDKDLDNTYAYNDIIGGKASTCGTVYGVYDMSGGAMDRVATYKDATFVGEYSRFGENISYSEVNVGMAFEETHGWNNDLGELPMAPFKRSK